MSPLRDQLADYLRIRRSLGYKLERAEKLLVWGAKSLFTPREHQDLQAEPSADVPHG